MAHDSKRAEKEYLARTAAGDWERSKPFAHGEANVIDDATGLIQDFAVMLRLLAPTPSDLILDLGAGACWCTDWLQRLNLRVVSVDIAFDMLRLGRTRLADPADARLVTGDMEALPFASGTFDLACCLSALHHVPAIPKALAEICRVLHQDGKVVFIEPGAGHASTPGSQAAMRDFGVLEQDIIVGDFMRQCLDAGFADVRLQPLAYAVPDIGVTVEQWRAWSDLTKRKRPQRAARKMWRAMLELAGTGKQGELIEETMAMSLVRVLKGAMDDHPVVIAYRKPPAERTTTATRGLHATIEVEGAPAATVAGGCLEVTVRLRNTGSETWLAVPAPHVAQTRLGVQLLDAGGTLLNRDYHRQALPNDVAAGASSTVAFSIPAPPPGDYLLKIDIVTEGVTWFEVKGTQPATLRLHVD